MCRKSGCTFTKEKTPCETNGGFQGIEKDKIMLLFLCPPSTQQQNVVNERRRGGTPSYCSTLHCTALHFTALTMLLRRLTAAPTCPAPGGILSLPSHPPPPCLSTTHQHLAPSRYIRHLVRHFLNGEWGEMRTTASGTPHIGMRRNWRSEWLINRQPVNRQPRDAWGISKH